ncbi:MAG: hypothetical protein RLZZ436_1878 [Planctomycetota bacterium]|jgi:hypothetical protein
MRFALSRLSSALTCCGLISVFFLVGCGEENTRVPTYPVRGRVTVDGKAPGSPLQIECHPVAGMDTRNPTVSRTECDEAGNFSISTYAAGDGVPAGDYVLTVTWLTFNLMSRDYTGPDKLNGRYGDPKTSEVKITVRPGEETDLGEIKLTTK